MSKQKTSKKIISLIIPMYNEESGIEHLFTEIDNATKGLPEEFEIICINDCSQDDTLAVLTKKQKKDKRIKIIDLSRNFGKEAALTAGIDHATGDAVIPMDADLQDMPDLIGQMIQQWKGGFKVVLATRRSRNEEGWLKKVTANMFYRLIGSIANIEIPQNTGDFRLMDRKVVDIVKMLPERTRFMKGLFAWVGFETTTIYFDRPNRKFGTTSWNYWKLWQFAISGIVSFSSAPLKIWSYIGMLISFSSILYAAYLVIRTLVMGVDVPGYASLMTAILFIGGVQLIGIGILGEYIARIYSESKGRPIYITKSKVGFGNERKK